MPPTPGVEVEHLCEWAAAPALPSACVPRSWVALGLLVGSHHIYHPPAPRIQVDSGSSSVTCQG